MIKSLISRAAAVLAGTVLTTAAVVGSAGTADAAVPCQPDRPCSTLSYDSATATVTAQIGPGRAAVEFFQVRWTITRNGVVQYFPQQQFTQDKQHATATFGPIAPADRSFTIGYSAQSCSLDLFGHTCTPWESQTIVPLPYGPDTCAAGYVWRDAFPGDHVCVSPLSRSEAAEDNAAAPYRVDPYGAYGPNTCVNGFVWRAARPGDLVCVVPAVRSQTAAENANPTAHRA